MCLIAFAWRADDRWPLVVAANRDEFYARPTASADWSSDGMRLSGRDLRGGGTWMSVTRDGRFAALTNHRDPSRFRPDAPSRGELVDRVVAATSLDAELAAIASTRGRFNGFHLLAAGWGSPHGRMAIVSHPGPDEARTVEPGIHALSNAALDAPWPKADALAARLRDAISTSGHEEDLVDRLMAGLADRRIAPDGALPSTGVPLALERALSAAFIRMPDYGTRSSTVLVVDADGRALFVERRCEPDAPSDERRFSFATPALSAARAT